MHLVDFQQLQNRTINSAVGGEEKPAISAGAPSEVTPSSCLTPTPVWFSPGFPATVAHKVTSANFAMRTVTSKQQIQIVRIHLLTPLFSKRMNNVIVHPLLYK